MRSTGALLVVGCGLLGCGADVEASCLQACEKSNECVETPQDCGDVCETAVEAAEQTGCQGDTARFYDCIASEAECSSDIGEDVCQEEFGELISCLLDYCLDNPSAEGCSGAFEDD